MKIICKHCGKENVFYKLMEDEDHNVILRFDCPNCFEHEGVKIHRPKKFSARTNDEA